MFIQILKKPATTAKDYDGRPDAVIADELWEMHKKRNSSVCVEMMQGQLKYGTECVFMYGVLILNCISWHMFYYRSRLVCPHCERVSVMFDPYSFVTVPLPIVTDKTQNVSVVLAGKPPMIFGGMIYCGLVTIGRNYFWRVLAFRPEIL